MRKNRRLQVLTGILFLSVVIAVLVMKFVANPGKPPPSASGYYTGVMKGKGSQTTYATEDGKVVPPPPGAPTGSAPKSDDSGL